jgi:hypothetical protein
MPLSSDRNTANENRKRLHRQFRRRNGFFHGAVMASVLASLWSAIAAAEAPAGAQEDDKREEDLGDALRSRLAAQRRRRSFCRSRFPSLTIILLTMGGTFGQSAGFTQYRGPPRRLWLWSRLSCPPRRLWLWSRRLWLRPRRHTRFVRLACAPSWRFLS